MRISRVLLLVITLVFGQAQANTVDILAGDPVLRDIKMSPDGKYLALLAPVDGRNVVSIIETETRQPVNILKFGSTKQIGDVYWANNERLILRLDYFYSWYAAASTAGEWYAVNINGKKRENIFGYRASRGGSSKIKTNDAADVRQSGSLVSLLKDDKRHVLMAGRAFTARDTVSRLYKVNIYTGKSKLVATSPVANASFVASANGDILVSIGSDSNLMTKLHKKRTKDSEWEQIAAMDGLSRDVTPLSIVDDQYLYVMDSSESDTATAAIIDLDSGETLQLFNNAGHDPTAFLMAPVSRKLVGLEYQSGVPEYVYLDQDSDYVDAYISITKALPGNSIRVTSATRDGSMLTVFVRSDTNPGDYYLFNREKNTFAYLASAKPSIDQDNLVRTEPISFTSSDDIEIFGYVTKPAEGTEIKGLVVIPHGGPIGVRDEWGFNYENQVLATNGFAILQVNYRGSSGYGSGFQEKGLRKWGSDIQRDIIEATRWAIAENGFDPKRVCIYGASFGGYSALQAPLVAPGLYSCAIGFVGVYDLPLLYEEGDIPGRRSGLNYLKRAIGDNKTELYDFSPVFHAAKLKDTPVFLIHGEEDPRAPIEHAYRMEKALKEANHPVLKTLYFEKEGHGLYEAGARARMYDAVLSFLDQHIESTNW
jgi:dipeptidyl aminopeptidase/acylaminoacyl peptidase